MTNTAVLWYDSFCPDFRFCPVGSCSAGVLLSPYPANWPIFCHEMNWNFCCCYCSFLLENGIGEVFRLYHQFCWAWSVYTTSDDLIGHRRVGKGRLHSHWIFFGEFLFDNVLYDFTCVNGWWQIPFREFGVHVAKIIQNRLQRIRRKLTLGPARNNLRHDLSSFASGQPPLSLFPRLLWWWNLTKVIKTRM